MPKLGIMKGFICIDLSNKSVKDETLLLKGNIIGITNSNTTNLPQDSYDGDRSEGVYIQISYEDSKPFFKLILFSNPKGMWTRFYRSTFEAWRKIA